MLNRLMKISLAVLVMALLLTGLHGAVFAAGKWMKADNGYQVWDPGPQSQPDETVTWSGGADGNGYVTGRGVLKWISHGKLSRQYEGDMLHGKETGTGVYFVYTPVVGGGHCEVDRYEGHFIDGKLNGQGKYSLAGGPSYEGDLVDGIPNGGGVLVMARGDSYTGHFVQGRLVGKGVWIMPGGFLRYEGEFNSAYRPDGKGVMLKRNGDRYEGDFVNGEYDGRGVLYHADGTIEQGQWSKGKLVSPE